MDYQNARRYCDPKPNLTIIFRDYNMNLNELYHKYEKTSLDVFLSKVVPHKQLATGSYGVVIITPNNYVYKLWTEDDAYDEFVELCQKKIRICNLFQRFINTKMLKMFF